MLQMDYNAIYWWSVIVQFGGVIISKCAESVFVCSCFLALFCVHYLYQIGYQLYDQMIAHMIKFRF